MKYIKYILSDMPGSAFLEHPEYLDDYLPWNPLVKEAKKDEIGEYDPEEVLFVVQGEMEYGNSLGQVD